MMIMLQGLLPISLVTLLATSISVLPAAVSAQSTASKSLNVSFPDAPDSATNVVQDNFLGISWELYVLNYLWGETPTTLSPSLQNYLSNIRSRMSQPLRIRIGGNSMDGSTYVPDQTNMISLTDPDAYYNDVPCDFGPMLFDVIKAMSGKVGSLQVILGLSMRDPGDEEVVKSLMRLAYDAETKLGWLGEGGEGEDGGGLLDALLLGNEPDLYAGHGERDKYEISDYIPEIATLIDELGNSEYGNLTEKKVLGGPTVCCGWDLDTVLDAGLKDFGYKYYTIQHYPTHVCGGVTASSSNITYYLSHPNTPTFLSWNLAGMSIAKSQTPPVPMLLTEYNSASCGGDPSVAPTFAAALWAVDSALQGAALDFEGMYLHTRELGVLYNLFDPPKESSGEDGALSDEWRTGAVYYAELVIAEALRSGGEGGGSVVVDLNLNGSTTNWEATVAGYAIYDVDGDGGKTKSKLALFNFDYPREALGESVGEDGRKQTFGIEANLTRRVAYRLFEAGNITSTGYENSTDADSSSSSSSSSENNYVKWAGQSADGLGRLQGDQELNILECWDGCEVVVPAPGFALVWLETNSSSSSAAAAGSSGEADGDEDGGFGNVYVGNATVAGAYVASVESNGATGFVSLGMGWSGFVGVFGLVLGLGL